MGSGGIDEGGAHCAREHEVLRRFGCVGRSSRERPTGRDFGSLSGEGGKPEHRARGGHHTEQRPHRLKVSPLA